MSHTSFSDLQHKVDKIKKQIPLGSKWIHFKDINAESPYEVVNVAIEEANEEIVVIYRKTDLPDSFCWVRPVNGENGWLSKNEKGNTRFTLLQTEIK